MKNFTILILFCLFSNSILVGEYFIVDDSKGDKLILKNDNTFIYEKRGDSCWFWQDVVGEWVTKGDILILFEIKYNNELDKDNKKITKKRKEIVEHHFKIMGKGLKAIKTDFSKTNTLYNKK